MVFCNIRRIYLRTNSGTLARKHLNNNRLFELGRNLTENRIILNCIEFPFRTLPHDEHIDFNPIVILNSSAHTARFGSVSSIFKKLERQYRRGSRCHLIQLVLVNYLSEEARGFNTSHKSLKQTPLLLNRLENFSLKCACLLPQL